MISNYTDAPTFVANTEIGAAELNILRTNAIVLDALSNRGRHVWQCHWKDTNFNRPERTALRLFRGGFRYIPGTTTATFGTSIDRDGGTEHLKIYFKRESDAEESIGTLVHTDTNPDGNKLIDIDITGMGFNAFEIIEVLVRIENGTTEPKTGIFRVTTAYLHPLSSVSYFGSYPGLPTITGDTSITAADMNQISNTSDWLMRRMRLAPRIPLQGIRFIQGTHKPIPEPLFRGTVMRTNGAETLYIKGNYYSYNVEDYLKFYVNSVLIQTLGPWTVGQSGEFEITYDLSGLLEDANYMLAINNEPVSGNPATQNFNQNSIFQFTEMEIINSAPAYTTPPTKFESLETMTFNTLRSRISTLRDMFNTIKSRIDANPDIFDKQYMFRRKYTNDDHQETKLNANFVGICKRLGGVIIVRGKDIRIAYGGIAIKPEFYKEPDKDPYKFTNEEQIIDGDKVQTKMIFLDQFKGLYPGTVYNILGRDLIYAAEYFNSN